MKTKVANRQKLELIFDNALQHKLHNQKFSSWLDHVSKYLAKALIQTDELQVWQKTTRQGDIYWKVYNPSTGQIAYFGSEAEVLSWVERRY